MAMTPAPHVTIDCPWGCPAPITLANVVTLRQDGNQLRLITDELALRRALYAHASGTHPDGTVVE